MQFKRKLLLFIILLFACSGAWAQVCTGSLGDPVFTFDFGSGNTPQFPVTGYQYVAGSCPDDGQYSLSKTETGCHDDTWHRVLKDHTGNDGYMMVVNADAVPGKEFFSKQTTFAGGEDALCANTTYEFSAYILNLIKAGQSGFTQPRITFRIEKLNGELIRQSDQPIDIPPTSNPDGWQKYGIFFSTTDETAVVVKIVNNAPGGANFPGNDLLLDDIAFRACGPEVRAGIADGAGNINTDPANQCVGTSRRYDIKSLLDLNPDLKYQWQQNINGTGWTDMAPETNQSLTFDFPPDKPAGIYQYHLGVAVGNNINSQKCRVYSNTFTININSLPPTPAPLSLTPCEGETIPFSASGGVTYIWTLPDMSVISQSSFTIPNATKANEGRYHVEIRSAADCPSFGYVDVTVNAKPGIATDLAQPVCRGSSTQLRAYVTDPGTDTYTYSWFPTTDLSDAHSATPMARPGISTPYTVTVTNDRTGCSSTRQVAVNVLDLPVAHAGNDKKIFEGQPIKLDGSVEGNVTYSWSPTDYLNDPNLLTPVATPPHDMRYFLTATSANGCGINIDDVFVRVYEKITIPSTFTPNNDGVNDIWNIEALETYPEGIISVFNRSGKQVFQSRGYSKPWDGKLNGSPLPAGTYYYVIDLKNDTPRLAGWVLLVR